MSLLNKVSGSVKSFVVASVLFSSLGGFFTGCNLEKEKPPRIPPVKDYSPHLESAVPNLQDSRPENSKRTFRDSNANQTRKVVKEKPQLLERVVEDASEDSFDTGITAQITDVNGHDYQFSNSYISPRVIGTEFNRTSLTIERNSIIHLFNLSKINKVNREEDGEVRVLLNNEKEFSGNWISNNRIYNFYRDGGNPSLEGYLYGLKNGKPHKINIDSIESIDFELEPANPTISSLSEEGLRIKYCPKKVETVSGTVFSGDQAYVLDFCGHYWSSYSHKRLVRSVNTLENRYSLDGISEITFTGEVDKENPQCREIDIKFDNGNKKREYLFLTSESYGGKCSHSSSFSGFDKFIISNPNGATLIPLDNVKKVTPLDYVKKSKLLDYGF